ncbi:MAG: cytoplasmic iron level regulating protein YaaA (DUF328/UPF0246 family) [Oleiphilaceae bacterium]|jgi:cytoplasmic iron level regulating protein YaaA (DUF328/UPF0246 family)
MLFIISPAKTLDFESSSFTDELTQPLFQTESSQLINIMQEYSSEDLRKMMKVSEKIADLNVARFKSWILPFDIQNAKQAIFAFKGDVYTGLAVETMDSKSLSYLQSNLRILSGLYGILKPLDLMQAYRLEMGTKLSHLECVDLYQFWGRKITDQVNEDLAEHDCLINLASNEYFKVIKEKQLTKKLITPVFKDEKNGKYKIISFYAKKARGLMMRFAADQQIQQAEDLKQFNYAGYHFDESESSECTWIFKRQEQKA